MPEFPLIDLLYQALQAEHGIVVRTSNVERLRAKLYAERKKDPDLLALSIVISRTQPDTEILIVRKK